MVLAKGVVIEPEDLPSAVRNDRAEIVSEREEGISSLDEVKSAAMQEAFKKSGNNISAAARELGISRRTLQRKLAVLGKQDKVRR